MNVVPQLVVPAAAVVLCRLTHPAPATALGVLLLACCPLGASVRHSPVPAPVPALQSLVRVLAADAHPRQLF